MRSIPQGASRLPSSLAQALLASERAPGTTWSLALAHGARIPNYAEH